MAELFRWPSYSHGRVIHVAELFTCRPTLFNQQKNTASAKENADTKHQQNDAMTISDSESEEDNDSDSSEESEGEDGMSNSNRDGSEEYNEGFGYYYPRGVQRIGD